MSAWVHARKRVSVPCARERERERQRQRQRDRKRDRQRDKKRVMKLSRNHLAWENHCHAQTS